MRPATAFAGIAAAAAVLLALQLRHPSPPSSSPGAADMAAAAAVRAPALYLTHGGELGERASGLGPRPNCAGKTKRGRRWKCAGGG